MIENFTDSIGLGFKHMITDFFKWIFGGVLANSFWICLIISMICLILYISGLKKAGKYCTVSFVIYIVIEALGSAFL